MVSWDERYGDIYATPLLPQKSDPTVKKAKQPLRMFLKRHLQ